MTFSCYKVCGQAFLLKVHPSPPSQFMASLENSGSPVRVNGLQVTVGPHDHHVRKEKNIELGEKWEGDFGVNWETNDDGDLEVVVEWTLVEMRKDFQWSRAQLRIRRSKLLH